jgi:hypothetical protein
MDLPPRSSFSKEFDESLYTAIVGFFNVIREETSREFTHFSMVMQTITASSFFTA